MSNILPTDKDLARELFAHVEFDSFFKEAPALIAQHREAHTAALEEQLRIAVEALESIENMPNGSIPTADIYCLKVAATDALQQIAALKDAPVKEGV